MLDALALQKLQSAARGNISRNHNFQGKHAFVDPSDFRAGERERRMLKLLEDLREEIEAVRRTVGGHVTPAGAVLH